MNLKRIIIDTDNGERFIYEDFTRGTYLDLSQEDLGWHSHIPGDSVHAAPVTHALDLRLRAGTVTITEALPGNTDYDWLVGRIKYLRQELELERTIHRGIRDAVASALGFDEKIAELNEQITDLVKENARLQGIIDIGGRHE